MKTFRDLWIRADILETIEAKGYTEPSPIQKEVIPLFLQSDKDIIGQAQTGTGKTASFGIPLLELIDRKSKTLDAIILCPTRELAIQVHDEIASLAPDNNINSILLYGGNPIRNEMRELKNQPNLVIGTPWRVIDHLQKGRLDLSDIKFFVLDEADEMLNIGFRDEIETIMASAPKEKRTLLFSATMPKEIMGIVKKYMNSYEHISVKKQDITNTSITQEYIEVRAEDKFEALTRMIEIEEDFYAIVFCKTKMDTDEVAARLSEAGYKAEGIHGDIEQKMREKVLSRFKTKKTNILVATDVAARGIDVQDITHVINYSLPENPEVYTHRIWRTGRAGKTGIAITFVTPRERRKIYYFENTIKAKIKKAVLPNASEVVEAKKKHLIRDIETLIESGDGKEYMELSKTLITLTDDMPELISALLKRAYNNQFTEQSYKSLKNAPVRTRNDNEMMRLFIAKGKKQWMTNPGKILEFIGTETDLEMKNAGKIDILNEFSFMDIPAYEWEIILEIFKQKNKRQPVVVEAKKKWWDSGSRGGFRRRRR